MQDNQIEAAFSELQKNMPRAPAALVERMVRTVNAMERERTRRAELAERKPVLENARQNRIDPAARQRKAPERAKLQPRAPDRGQPPQPRM